MKGQEQPRGMKPKQQDPRKTKFRNACTENAGNVDFEKVSKTSTICKESDKDITK